MSFTLKFTPNLSTNTSIPVIDSTGVYSATEPLNLTGWGAPNPSISDCVTATLTVTTKDTAVPYVIDVFSTLPNITSAPFTILPSMIGYTGTIPDQILQIVYTVTGILGSGTPFTFSTGCLFLVGIQLNCCVQNKLADAASEVACHCKNICDCHCKNSSKSFKAIQAQIMLTGLQTLVNNRQIHKGNQVLALLQALCNCN